MDHYTYQITWYAEDQEYLGRCVEFPSLSWLDKTQSKTLKGITNLVRETVADLEANNEPDPEPLAGRKNSGESRLASHLCCTANPQSRLPSRGLA